VLAGNDLLCLPAELPQSIALIRKAIRKHQLTWKDINARVVKILMANYQAGLSRWKPLSLDHLTEDLNEGIAALQRKIAEASITLLRHETSALFPLPQGKRVAYIGLGIERDNELSRIMRQTFQAHVYYFPYQLSTEQAQALSVFLRNQYDVVVLGLHNYSRRPAGNFGLSTAALQLIQQVQQQQPTITLAFGNPYAIKNFCTSPTLLACYEDDSITQQVAAELLQGKLKAKGKLPVRVCDQFPEGFGLTAGSVLPYSSPEVLGFAPQKLRVIDSIVNDAIRMQAIPGAVVLVAKNGKVAYEKAFGYMAYDSSEAVRPETLYDLASVTKIMATTLSVMKLYEEGQIDLQKTIGDYLPWVKGSNKQDIRLWDVLLHQAGLKSWIPFYKETVDTTLGNIPLTTFYVSRPDASHRVRVASGMYMRQDWVDTMYQRILVSEKGAPGAYVYSDNDFIFLGKIVEAVSGMSLDRYVKQTFYDPLQLNRTVFRPRDYFPLTAIAPTEEELGFRQQLIRGDVHDPGAAMFGGVAGHAGLFSTAQDLAVLAEALLNGGEYNGFKLFKPETIQLFTSYQSNSRRGLGFDKPERDNAIRPEPYPALSASPETFGHTGFTGTCVWMDPKQHLTFILLSNRVHNNGDPNCFLRMSVRPKVLEAVYQALR
ncbi:MAG: serine hydrolase, partial [Chitinophagaceae bacterium]